MDNEIRVSVVRFPKRTNLMLRFIDPVTKKQVHKSAGTSKAGEAQKAAGKWEDELRSGKYCGSKITWADFRRRYEDEVLASLAAATDRKVSAIFDSVEKHVGPNRLRDLSSERLSLLQFKLRDAKLAESTIKAHLAHLMAALKWAASVGMLAAVPKVKMPKRAKGSTMMKGRPITGEEFDRMLAAVGKVFPAAGTQICGAWKFYLRGLWASGLRLTESLELTWDRADKLQVDMQPGEHPMLRIPAALEKGNTDRLLPMAPEFAELLQSVLEAERTGYVFNPLGKAGKRVGSFQVCKVVADIGKAAGVVVNKESAKFASAHDLRRSFGQRWASRVMPQILMELMRHESIETTLRFYVGRNAQTTAAVLWDAHRAAATNTKSVSVSTGKQTGNTPSQGDTMSPWNHTEKLGISK